MVYTLCFPNGVAHQPQRLLPCPREEPLLHGSSVAIPAIGRIPFDGYEEKRSNRFGEKRNFFWRMWRREAIVWERRKYHSLIVVYEDAKRYWTNALWWCRYPSKHFGLNRVISFLSMPIQPVIIIWFTAVLQKQWSHHSQMNTTLSKLLEICLG